MTDRNRPDFWWEFQHLFLGPTEEVRAKAGMKLLYKLLVKLFVLLLELLKISPFIGVEEVHQVEELANLVVQRSLRRMSVRKNRGLFIRHARRS